MRAYLAGPLPVSVFDAQLNRRDAPELDALGSNEAELALADLLAIHSDTAYEAQARLRGIAADSCFP